MCESVGKIIARTLCFTHPGFFRPIYSFNNDAYFYGFSRTKLPFGFYLNLNEPVSVKTGLNDIEMKIQITALRESISFSECFL